MRKLNPISEYSSAGGSTLRWRSAGADIAAWSFHPRKLLTTGEGGMITTSRADWAARARRLREHAMTVAISRRRATMAGSLRSCTSPTAACRSVMRKLNPISEYSSAGGSTSRRGRAG
jgi:dTDP-4-amino-4,6-dideoxygalactose transaminase